MRPQKTKDLLPAIAEDIGIPLQDLEYMVTAEFQYVKDMMNSFTTPRIFLSGIGSFFFRVWKIEPEVEKCCKMLKDQTLPIGALLTIQEKKENFVHMDRLILEEMIRRKKEWDRYKETGHLPSAAQYNKGCRCMECRIDKNKVNKAWKQNDRENKARDANRLEKLREYESKGKTAKGLGEQEPDSRGSVQRVDKQQQGGKGRGRKKA